MPTGTLLMIIAAAATQIVIGVAAIVWHWSSDKALIGLSLVACAAALVFAPLVRTAPEEIGISVFMAGGPPILATLTAAVVVSALRVWQTKRWASVPGLVLSVAAVGIMVVNASTPLI